jgi:2-dehydro-3-deoxygalactonokinase
VHGAGIRGRRRLDLKTDDWVGIDWGTTHRRAWRFAGDALAGRAEDAQGLTACAPHFARSLSELLRALGVDSDTATIVMAGMVGSASGWQEVPYLDADTALDELPARVQRVTRPDAPARTFIVPGVCWRGADGAVDVMRGEETQLLGARQLLGERSDGWYVLPGTHSKWVQLRAGRVGWMRTYLSGELFGLLRERGTLSSIMRSGQLGDALSAAEQTAFQQGVAVAAGAALGNALFAARARVVTGGLAPELGAAFVSGALLGSEWHDMARHLEPGQTVRLIGEARLCAHHARCAGLLGFTTEALDTPALQAAAWLQLRKDGPR